NISSIFEKVEMAMPPKLPTEGIKAELILVIMNMEQDVISNTHILLEIENPEEGRKENTLRYSDGEGRISLNLNPGSWQINAKIDDFSTPGKDYISNRLEIHLWNSTTRDLFMLPVGSLRGNVYNELGERIVGAKVKVDCARDWGDKDTVSDDFGSFSLDYVPVGSCEVSALSDNKVGVSRINITRGELKTINIILGQEVKSGFDLTTPLIALFLITAVVVFLYFSKGKKPRVIEKETRIELTGRMEDIIQTLTDREKSIVNLLIESDGKLTQAEARHFLGIPKATISRDVNSLKRKRIVETIKIGRNRDIRLSRWFLGLEE
ncbi:MAG: hypothetical protein KAU03_06250, partial [Candidatus Altiarchaeales archaeon]|nr:hypothetical protein [Candidatus Altiarchaeales archaeon]